MSSADTLYLSALRCGDLGVAARARAAGQALHDGGQRAQQAEREGLLAQLPHARHRDCEQLTRPGWPVDKFHADAAQNVST